MKIFDVHCHVYPPAIAEKAAEAVAEFYQVHRGEEVPHLTGTLETLLREQGEAGITQCLIHSVATVPHQVQRVNASLARIAGESGGRCIAFGSLHPDSPNLAADVEHLLGLGLRGAKLHPDMQDFALNDSRAMRLFEAGGNRLVFLLHTGDKRFHRSNPPEFRAALEAFPHTVFIGAHMGGQSLWEEATHTLAGKYENLYVDVSSTMYAMSSEQCVRLIRAFGADRVLFGTDFPMFRPKDEVENFLALPLTEAERHAILWDNAARLLCLQEPPLLQ